MDQDRNQDRDRLREVHRHEQTESRVNEDFVEWLKTKGPSWLLMILIVLTAYLALVNWRERQAGQRAEAWSELREAQAAAMPSTLEMIAERYEGVDGVAIIAWLNAADSLLESVQLGVPLDARQELFEFDDIDEDELPSLTDEDRASYLDRADRLYQQVLQKDDGSWRKALYAINALNGRAAIAEARDEIDRARELYEQAAQRAETHFPGLAEQARKRIDTLDDARPTVTFLRRGQIARDEADDDRDLRPLTLESAFQDILLTQDDLTPTEPERPALPDAPVGLPPDLPPELLEDLPPELLEQLRQGAGGQAPPPGLPGQPQ